MTSATQPKKPPPLPKTKPHRAPADQPPPSASATMPIAPEDIISELDK